MQEAYLWEVEYSVQSSIGVSHREIKIVTLFDKYAAAEKSAIEIIKNQMELSNSNFSFLRLTNIKASEKLFIGME